MNNIQEFWVIKERSTGNYVGKLHDDKEVAEYWSKQYLGDIYTPVKVYISESDPRKAK